jgi:hypothetical protein
MCTDDTWCVVSKFADVTCECTSKYLIQICFRELNDSQFVLDMPDIFSSIASTVCLHRSGQYPVANGIVTSAACPYASKTACSSFGSIHAL